MLSCSSAVYHTPAFVLSFSNILDFEMISYETQQHALTSVQQEILISVKKTSVENYRKHIHAAQFVVEEILYTMYRCVVWDFDFFQALHVCVLKLVKKQSAYISVWEKMKSLISLNLQVLSKVRSFLRACFHSKTRCSLDELLKAQKSFLVNYYF